MEAEWVEACEEREQAIPASPRRRARAAALQVLYEVDSSGHDSASSLRWVQRELELPKAFREFAAWLVNGVLERQTQVDDLIRQYAPAFPIDQLALVDRNLLRLSLFELLNSGDTPAKAIINEAVDLAKLFGSDSASRFVNGVLGSYMDWRARQPDTSGPMLGCSDQRPTG